VDTEGYVRLHTNRYSVPEERIGQQLEIHETLETVRVFDGHCLVAEHSRREDGACERVTLPKHRGRHSRRSGPRPPSPEERALRAAGPALAALCDALRKDPARGRKAVLRLYRLWCDYPAEALEPAVARALDFGLVDVGRIEGMVLKNLGKTWFRLPTDPEESDG
jgi:hypothetical protein